MTTHHVRAGLLLLVCLMLVACEDRREPVKPTVALAPAGAVPAVSTAV
jgi:hypothetical protein